MKAQIRVWRSSVCGLRSSSCGFTLVELLVAMGILMIIVMMMANLFKQSSIAWESGRRQAEAGLEARAVIGMIQKELSQAVVGGSRAFTASGGSLDFWTLGELSATNREARRVRYSHSVGVNPVLRKRINDLPQYDLLQNVTRFEVVPTYAAGTATNDLPLWVDIHLVVSASSDMSSIRTWSLGNPEWDTGDYRLPLLRSGR